MELPEEEPRANTAIKCPTDLFAAQTVPSASAHGDESANTQHPSVVYAHIQVSPVQRQMVDKSECTGQCKPILLGTTEMH